MPAAAGAVVARLASTAAASCSTVGASNSVRRGSRTPKALLIFVVEDDRADRVVAAISDSARSGNEAGDGLVWTTSVGDVTHNRTGMPVEEVEVG